MIHRYLDGVQSLTLIEEKCTGCGRCTEVCPHAVFELVDRKAVIVAFDRCMECGACAQNCIFGAITVRAGVGCAAAMLDGIITKGDPDLGSCDCGTSSSGCC